MTAWVVLALLSQPSIEWRPYHAVPLERLAESARTHVQTCGLVVYRRKMKDGDWHITLERAAVKIVLEIIPLIPIDPPRKNQRILAWGIARYDRQHRWAEIHPVEGWMEVASCPM